jgi:hypothetical protein
MHITLNAVYKHLFEEILLFVGEVLGSPTILGLELAIHL